MYNPIVTQEAPTKGTVTEPNIPGAIYKTNNSLYFLIPEKLRLDMLWFAKARVAYKIARVTETSEYVEVTYQIPKKKQ